MSVAVHTRFTSVRSARFRPVRWLSRLRCPGVEVTMDERERALLVRENSLRLHDEACRLAYHQFVGRR